MRASAEIVDRRFLEFLTDLLLCSRCFQLGVRTRVPQAISHRHTPVGLCRHCRTERATHRH